MRIIVVLLQFLLLALPVMAQQTVSVSGKVSAEDTGKPIAAASVVADDGRTATVTNDDGRFTIKVPVATRHLQVSCLGYAAQRVALPHDGQPLAIRLHATTVTLAEVLVASPEDILKMAMAQVPNNYVVQPAMQQCFYRETTRKGKRFIYVAEAVTDMYKSPYGQGVSRDRVAIRKARRLVSTQASDTLGAKIAGGPVMPIDLDMVKDPSYLLNDELLSYYSFSMRPGPLAQGRQQVVVTIKPKMAANYALLMGDFYIDTETLGITHIQLELDISDRDKATRYMLYSKPAGVRFKPLALDIRIDYKPDNAGRLSLNYIRTDVSFRCEWRRRLFASPYKVTAEAVVTDQRTTDVRPIKGKSSFQSREALYDRVSYFSDPLFWEQYNIIEPTQSLVKGIESFLKKNHKR